MKLLGRLAPSPRQGEFRRGGNGCVDELAEVKCLKTFQNIRPVGKIFADDCDPALDSFKSQIKITNLKRSFSQYSNQNSRSGLCKLMAHIIDYSRWFIACLL